MEPIAKLKELPPSSPKRPGRVQKLMGIIFQSDQKSVLGSWIIRPVEMLDRRLAGLGRSPDNPPLAMHVGIHVLIEDGREFVVEQLVGTPFEDFVDGLNWTPLETFRARDRGGWDVTIPATAFRGIDDEIVEGTIDFLNVISVRPFFDEDCTTMVWNALSASDACLLIARLVLLVLVYASAILPSRYCVQMFAWTTDQSFLCEQKRCGPYPTRLLNGLLQTLVT